MANIIDYLGQQWNDAVADLRAKAEQFSVLYDRLVELKNVALNSPDLINQYNALMKKGDQLRSTIQTTMNAVEQTIKTVKGFFGVGNLGVLPLIPIAIIVAAVSALGIWIVSATETITKLESRERLLNKGITPDQLVKIEQGKKGLLNFNFPGSEMIIPVSLTVGAIFLLSKLYKR